MTAAAFGSISTGTMRSPDLIASFGSALGDLVLETGGTANDDAYLELVRKADSDYPIEEADQLLEDLIDALDDFAPRYGYFGSQPGDGADFGFWLFEDFESWFDGLKVNDTSEVPADYTGEVLHVNDHGNMTLYAAVKGELTEIWALV